MTWAYFVGRTVLAGIVLIMQFLEIDAEDYSNSNTYKCF